MKPMLTSLALAALILTAFAPQGHSAPAKMVAQVQRTMGKAAQANNAAAKAKGMGYYKQCMAA